MILWMRILKVPVNGPLPKRGGEQTGVPREKKLKTSPKIGTTYYSLFLLEMKFAAPTWNRTLVISLLGQSAPALTHWTTATVQWAFGTLQLCVQAISMSMTVRPPSYAYTTVCIAEKGELKSKLVDLNHRLIYQYHSTSFKHLNFLLLLLLLRLSLSHIWGRGGEA